jgi:hypothetical protein
LSGTRVDIIVPATKATESRKLSGIAAIPRVSLNGRLYLPEDLLANDGVTTPLLWHHDGTPSKLGEAIPHDKIIGKIAYKFDPAKQQLLYEATLDNDTLPLDETYGVSIGAFYNADHVCGSTYCYEVAKNLRIVEGSLVPNPGIPETSVKIIESAPAVAQCAHKHELSSVILSDSTSRQTMSEQAPAQAAKATEAAAAQAEPKAAPAANTVNFVSEAQLKQILEAQGERYKNDQQKMLDKLTESIGALKVLPKAEPAAPVSDAAAATGEANDEFKRVVEWFSRAKGGTKVRDLAPIGWSIDKDAALKRFGYPVEHDGALRKAREDVTYSAPPQGYVKKAIFLPGGRIKVPVRQFCDYVALSGEDRAHWYTIGGVDFGAGTEGSDPFVAASSQTITQKTATPAVRGAFQKVKYTQIEDQPFDLVGTINMAFALAAIDDEATDLLSTVYGAVTPTNWVNGETGAVITADDISGTTLTRDGVLAAKTLIMAQGYDTSPGNLVLFVNPKQYQELLLDTNITTFTQYARPEVTALGALEQLYGVDIVISDHIQTVDRTTNDSARAVMAVKGQAFGMASARDLQMEASRRNELQQVFLTGTHRVKSVVLDETATCRISTTL